MSEIIKNGDIWDIGQTVNGVSRFVFIDGIWYYYEERMVYEKCTSDSKAGIPNSLTEYEYGMHSITEVIWDDAAMGHFKCRRVGNINDLMRDMIVVK
jgi:hypothetical protein